MEDTAIIDLYWARSQQAVAASEEKYGPYCHTIARRILDREEDAEECVNDTWQRAWDTMPPQRPSSLRAYFAKITRNLSIDRWRARRAEKRGAGLSVLLDELEESLPLPAAPSAEEIAEARETARAMRAGVSSTTVHPVDCRSSQRYSPTKSPRLGRRKRASSVVSSSPRLYFS